MESGMVCQKSNTFTPLSINENRRDISKNTGARRGLQCYHFEPIDR
jgi:hypothetical protein